MKKIFKVLSVLTLCILSCFGFVACKDDVDTEETKSYTVYFYNYNGQLYKLNGKSYQTINENGYAVSPTKNAQIPKTYSKKYNYEFIGWSTKEDDLNSTELENRDDMINLSSYQIKEDTSFYPHYNLKLKKINFSFAINEDEYSNLTVEYSGSVGLPVNPTSAEGKAFMGWSALENVNEIIDFSALSFWENLYKLDEQNNGSLLVDSGMYAGVVDYYDLKITLYAVFA